MWMSDASDGAGPNAFETPFGPLPREPSAYTATAHFGQRVREREVPDDAIRACITGGEAKHSSQRGTYFLERTWLGTRWRVVVSHSGDGGWRAVSVYRRWRDDTDV